MVTYENLWLMTKIRQWYKGVNTNSNGLSALGVRSMGYT